MQIFLTDARTFILRRSLPSPLNGGVRKPTFARKRKIDSWTLLTIASPG
jgi:hypothetical protein